MKYLFTSFLLFLASFASAQINPLKWTFSAEKTGTGTYEVHLKATIDQLWHLYSQTTPTGGPIPTTVKFNKNPLVTLEGKVTEQGKLIKKLEEVFGVKVTYYEKQVEFIQRIKVRGGAKTNVSGKISYMVCKDEMCLPPTTEKFHIKLE